MKRFAFVILAGSLLAGCAGLSPGLSVSQQDAETAYTLTTNGADAVLKLGKMSAEQAGQACVADGLAYSLLTGTRNVADGVNYKPADTAHANLQTDGARLAPDQCTAPPAK